MTADPQHDMGFLYLKVVFSTNKFIPRTSHRQAYLKYLLSFNDIYTYLQTFTVLLTVLSLRFYPHLSGTISFAQSVYFPTPTSFPARVLLDLRASYFYDFVTNPHTEDFVRFTFLSTEKICRPYCIATRREKTWRNSLSSHTFHSILRTRWLDYITT
jgi:hypothetical protein